MSTPHILLINPNSSRATSEMMLAIARRAAAGRIAVEVATAMRNPEMIVTSKELEASEAEVAEIGLAHQPGCLSIVVSAYGDPGVTTLKARLGIPVIGICEASMIEASRGGRRFGVATVTPDLARPIAERAAGLGLSHLYTGIRLTWGDPMSLTREPALLVEALAEQVRAAIELDGAEAVIIGGGPLGQAAEGLQPLFATPVIAPIPSAVAQVIGKLARLSEPAAC